MKKYLLFRRLFLILAATGGLQYVAKGQLEGTWSGTVTMHERYDGITGWSELWINTSFTATKGQGTIKSESELIVGGKKLGKASCGGQGVAELVNVDFNADSTYRIYVIGPECTSGPDPRSAHQNDLEVADEPFTGNPNLLSGTRTTVTTMAGDQGKVTVTLTWNLVRTLDVELIVTPQDYDSWLPKPGKDEISVGNEMSISLKLQGKNGKPLTDKARAFELRLSGTSNEKGTTLNMPLKLLADLPDLRFMTQPNAEMLGDFQSMKISCPGGCTTANAKIGSYDGGGWTTLTVRAILEDNTAIVGSLLVSGGETDITVPKRMKGSNIATSWLNANGNPGETIDEEKSTGNTNDGDGLSAYEEYRGVISEGKFLRLDPNKKELGVCGKRSDLVLCSGGFALFESASTIKVVRFTDAEIDLSRRLNKNASHANVFPQYVLKFEKGNLPYGEVGKAFGNGGPSTTPVVVIDSAQIPELYRKFQKEARPAQLLYTVSELLANTVAHEMTHGLNVIHHGKDPNEPDPQTAQTNSFPPYRIFRYNSTVPVTTRPFTLEDIGTSGTQQSGDLLCIIAYNPYHKWAFTIGADGANIFNEVPLLPMGKRLCTSGAGTGINAGVLYFGNAARGRGNCLGQLNLKL